MRRTVLLCCAAVLAGCSKPANPPAADTTAVAPAPPAPLTGADLAGKWHVRVMPEASDSVVTEYDIVATAADTGWTVMLPKRPVMSPRVMFMGDSVVIDMGPFESVLRKGVKVTTHGSSRLVGGELIGYTVAHYTTKSADSVVMLRTKGTRTP